jgi:hypothetical protein
MTVMSATLSWLAFVSASPLILALAAACIVVALAVPYAASRGRLHTPGYVGLALASFVVAFIVGKISGAQGVRGRHSGEALSIVFFLLMAAALGSVLAIFFHRDPPQE